MLKIIDQSVLPDGLGIVLTVQVNNNVVAGDQLIDAEENVATVVDRATQSVEADRNKIISVLVKRRLVGTKLKLIHKEWRKMRKKMIEKMVYDAMHTDPTVPVTDEVHDPAIEWLPKGEKPLNKEEDKYFIGGL